MFYSLKPRGTKYETEQHKEQFLNSGRRQTVDTKSMQSAESSDKPCYVAH